MALDAALPGTGAEDLSAYPPEETWDHVESLDPAAWPKRVRRTHRLAPTPGFTCEAKCLSLTPI